MQHTFGYGMFGNPPQSYKKKMTFPNFIGKKVKKAKIFTI